MHEAHRQQDKVGLEYDRYQGVTDLMPFAKGVSAKSHDFNDSGEEINTDCDLEDFDPADMPAWLAKRLTKERLQVMCERMTAEDGQGLKGFLDKLACDRLV